MPNLAGFLLFSFEANPPSKVHGAIRHSATLQSLRVRGPVLCDAAFNGLQLSGLVFLKCT